MKKLNDLMVQIHGLSHLEYRHVPHERQENSIINVKLHELDE